MTLTTDQYDAAYFGDTEESGGLRHIAGYSHYLEKANAKPRFDLDNRNKPYNIKLEGEKKLLELEGLENSAIVELGGACGHLGAVMLEEGFDWTVVDVSDWCRRNKVIADVNFIHQDALSYLQAQSNNSIDAIFSTRFLVCFEDADVQILLDEIRRVAKKQIHLIDEQANPTFYNKKTLEQWQSQFDYGPPNRTTLISVEDRDVIRF